MVTPNNNITIIGETDFRGERIKFGIRDDDRRRHIYIIGKTGMGKTTLLENLVIQDLRRGNGVGVIDPHGEFAEKMLYFVPEERIEDVIYFNPADTEYPIGFNVMETKSEEERHLVASGLMGVFKKIWPDVWSARMEYILNNTILALLELPDATLLGINKMLGEDDYRTQIVKNIKDPVVGSFWINEFAKYPDRFLAEAVAPIQNKAGQFITNPLIRNIVGQLRSTINMRKIMDEKKIFIANLSKGKIGEDNSALLGAMLITKLQLAAMGRVDVAEDQRVDYYLYVDEFQNFATQSFVNIFSEARKYRLSLTLAHQYIGQLLQAGTEKTQSTVLKDAIFGNVGTIITFRVGAEDGEFIEKEFLPEFNAQDLVNLPKYRIYLRLMIDGIASRPFSANTLAPYPKPKKNYKKQIINSSRELYASQRKEVEQRIREWAETGTILTPQEIEKRMKRPPQVILYDAVCSNCSKKTKVIFRPEEGKKIYCKKCLKKLERAKEKVFAKSETLERTKETKKEKEGRDLKSLILEALKMREK